MNPTDSIKMATKSLWSHKISSSLAILGMLIGNAAIITMIGIDSDQEMGRMSGHHCVYCTFQYDRWAEH